jgi:NAD+ synthase
MPAQSTLRIALAQLDPIVGDLSGNAGKIRRARAEAQRQKADLLLTPELFLTGYPPEDLVLKPAFVRAAMEMALKLAAETADGGPAVLLGTVWGEEGKVYNAVALLDAGKVETIRTKVDLPNYGVFDEKRVFAAGPMPGPIPFKGVRIGVPICEDIWGADVVECLAETGAEILLVPNGSPFEQGKQDVRMNIAVARVTESGLPLLYLNQMGGQDELVFDGASFVLNADRSLAVQLPAWEETVATTTWRKGKDGWACKEGERAIIEEGDLSAYLACVRGLRDYVDDNRFPGVVLGLSGGVDSALVAALASDALGPERVHALMLPYRYTSSESLADAAECAKALGIRYDIVPIHAPVDGFMSVLGPLFEGLKADTTEENIQSRTRGSILMAVSNKLGSMLLTTGNKSEMSVGYATLYGDMNGGFNPIKDLYKMQVYALSRLRNGTRPKGCLGAAGEVIPERILTKAPTAELKPNQTDQDTLPPYPVLDDILACLVDNEMPLEEIIARGHPAETVRRIERMLYIAEYKRRQSAPGVKISARNFGRDRRYPITNWFRERVE